MNKKLKRLANKKDFKLLDWKRIKQIFSVDESDFEPVETIPIGEETGINEDLLADLLDFVEADLMEDDLTYTFPKGFKSFTMRGHQIMLSLLDMVNDNDELADYMYE